MKLLLLLGMCLVALALACPHLIADSSQAGMGDPVHAGLLGMGLLALGIARKHQNKPEDDA